MKKGIIAALMIAVVILACQNPSAQTPVPTPPRVEEVYRALEQEKFSNINRLRTREDDREEFRFRGNVTRIEEGEIRFYVEPPMTLAEDLYVECNFKSNRSIASVNVGDEVTVRGELARAFRGRLFGIGETKAVIFENCEIEDGN